MHKRATAVIEAEVGKRGDLTEREKRQVEQLALAMVASHEHAERERSTKRRKAANCAKHPYYTPILRVSSLPRGCGWRPP
jgi:hypothetical protein